MLLPSERDTEKGAFPSCISEVFYLKKGGMDCGFRRTEGGDEPSVRAETCTGGFEHNCLPAGRNTHDYEKEAMGLRG